MRLILDPVSSSARQWIGCLLLLKRLICAVIIISLDNDSGAVGLVCSVVNGVIDCRRHWSCVRLSLEAGLGGEVVRGVSDLWMVL